MNCCKSQLSSEWAQQTTQPKLKYSFATNSNVFVNSSLTHTTAKTANRQTEFSTGYYQQQQEALDREYQQLLEQNNKLNEFVEKEIQPLERQVQFYEHEVVVREKQIAQLNQLLNQTISSRRPIRHHHPHAGFHS